MSSKSKASKGKAVASSSSQNELSDLEFAMQLSLAEEASRKEAEEAFPPLSPILETGSGSGKGKGKGKGKM